MIRIEYLKLGLGTMLLRYYLMMLIIIAAGFIGSFVLGLLALPVFISTILGVTFKFGKEKKTSEVKNFMSSDTHQVA